MAQTTPASTLETLSRLAAKPGVQSTLILSKSDGSIIQSTGLFVRSIRPSASSGLSPLESPDTIGNGTTYNGSGDMNASQDSLDPPDESRKGNTAEEVAMMVFAFVTAAKEFAESMDAADEVKLLRTRTRKNEIVIVPDAKFLLVVIHNTPPA